MNDLKNTILAVLATATLSTAPLFASTLSPEDQNFSEQHPGVPGENHACTLDNYDPKNASQEEALKWATRVMGLESGVSAGLWLWGSVGIGKTHLSVGILEALCAQGKRVYFFTDEHDRYLKADSLSRYDAFVLDNINSLSFMHKAFQKIIFHCFNEGKQIFLTGNVPYKTVVQEVFSDIEGEMPRFMDRIHSMIKVIHVEGVSQRPAASWMGRFSDDEEGTSSPKGKEAISPKAEEGK